MLFVRSLFGGAAVTAASSPQSTLPWGDGPRDRYYNFTAYDPDDEDYDPYRAPYYGGLIQEGVGETDRVDVLSQ